MKTITQVLLCVVGLAGLAHSAFGQAPTILSVTPTPGSTVANLTNLTNATITFSEPVVGLMAADLLVNEVPATARTGSGATHTFHFSSPLPGPVALNVDTDAAITDAEGNAFDPFAPNASWSYTLADSVPPVVRSITPAAGAVVGTLTLIIEFAGRSNRSPISFKNNFRALNSCQIVQLHT